eukprot:s9465_g2.t1
MKAYVKPKAKASMPTMKKPGMANPGEQGMINRSIEEMKAGVGLDMTESRGKGKALKCAKYAKMKEQGALPEHKVSLVENESKKAVSSRQFKTMAINRLFKRDGDGTISLSMGDGLFAESQEVFSQTHAKKKEKALPKSIVCGLYFQNDTKSFDAALANGDLEECEEDGYYEEEYVEVLVEDELEGLDQLEETLPASHPPEPKRLPKPKKRPRQGRPVETTSTPPLSSEETATDAAQGQIWQDGAIFRRPSPSIWFEDQLPWQAEMPQSESALSSDPVLERRRRGVRHAVLPGLDGVMPLRHVWELGLGCGELALWRVC